MPETAEQPPVTEEPVADAAMDAKLRQIWATFDKPWIRKTLQQMLPPTRMSWMNCKFVVHPSDNFTEFKMWELGRPPEHEATAALAARLKGQPCTIVDVGANAGAFSLPLIKAGRGARGVLVEPNPVMRARLERNVALNRFRNIEICDCAVGESAGEAILHFPKNGNLGQGRIDVSYEGGAEGARVAVRPLADIVRDAGVEAVTLLKVDVEGMEDRVICPFLADRSAPKPQMIYFEIAHDGVWARPLLDDLESHGYRQVDTFGANALFELETP
jgi:FkbM family methyltransferase